MKLFWKRSLAASSAAVLALLSAAALAQDFPTKPIRIIVPYSAGGTTDMLARTVGRSLNDRWGQPVVVENRPGANGMIGMDAVAKAPADGYTLGLASPGTHAINQSLYPKMMHDPLRDFQPVSLLVEAPMGLVVNAAVPVNSVQELIELAKAKPGTLNFASGGTGSSQHLAYELFRAATGIEGVHVPYKGGGAAYSDLVGGQVDAMFDVVQQALPHVKSGKLKLLAVASRQRLDLLPDTPTIIESGVPDFEAQSWYGLVAPAGVPKPILDQLAAGIAAAIEAPQVNRNLLTIGLVPAARGPQQFTTHIRAETEKYGEVIKAANIKPE
ncbi:tripartite tricarboxylate transporter substrate binding protein [Parapusillimonas sp. SGNA-6]|nr:tripartite tricarboxylate transporter substrate binding protein [Parapusillimonas sp. SGNA-6]